MYLSVKSGLFIDINKLYTHIKILKINHTIKVKILINPLRFTNNYNSQM